MTGNDDVSVEESDSDDEPKRADTAREKELAKLPFGGETAKLFIRMRQESRSNFKPKVEGDN
jgi:hypothetical protein